MRKLTKIISIISIIYPLLTFAAWPYTQDFESLTTGDLNGQDSWSGNVNFDVTATGPIEGSQSVVINSSTEDDITRTITSTTDGIGSWKLKKVSDGAMFWFQLREGATYKFDVGMNDTENIQVRGATTVTVLTGALNTIYTIDFEYDVSTDQARARVDGGAWSSWVNFASAATAIDSINMSKQNANTGNIYFDDIKNGAAVTTEADQQVQIINFEE